MNPPERLFELLSEAAQHAVPLGYRFVPPPSGGPSRPVRAAESRPYRSKGYDCEPFHKPLSRCFGPPRGD